MVKSLCIALEFPNSAGLALTVLKSPIFFCMIAIVLDKWTTKKKNISIVVVFDRNVDTKFQKALAITLSSVVIKVV